MAYDQELADRLRAALSTEPGVSEKAMFGGLAFLVDGAMAVAAAGPGSLMVRCDPADADALTSADGVERMVMHGRELDGWLLVAPDALEDQAALRRWVATGRDVARAKAASRPRTRPRARPRSSARSTARNTAASEPGGTDR